MAQRRRGRPAHPDVLTPSEWEVLELYRHGLTRRSIAERRGVSEYAVRDQLRSIRGKLGFESPAQLRDWPGFRRDSPVAPAATRSRRYRPMSSHLALGRLGQVSLLCRSAAETERWYAHVLGLAHLFTFGDLVFFDCDGTRLYFREVAASEWRPGSTLYFSVSDIHAAHALLTERNVSFNGAPHVIHRHPDGAEEWMAFFSDPDGNTLALMSRVESTPA